MKAIKAFILDMDGTIYLGNDLFPYTHKFLDKVKETGRDYYFFTNNSSRDLDAYITKLKKKGFVDTQVKGNYSYITAKITEEMYREEQMELMKDFWHDGSMKELVQTLTHTISKEEKEELKDLINDLDD